MLPRASLQGQNELWLALVLTHPVMIGLTGPELAGVLGAILCGEVVRKPGEIAAAYTASQRVRCLPAAQSPRVAGSCRLPGGACTRLLAWGTVVTRATCPGAGGRSRLLCTGSGDGHAELRLRCA